MLRILSATAESFEDSDVADQEDRVSKSASPDGSPKKPSAAAAAAAVSDRSPYSPHHCRKRPSPSRSLKHVDDRTERERQGFFIYNPFTSPPPPKLSASAASAKRAYEDADYYSFSDSEDRPRRRRDGSPKAVAARERKRYRHRSREHKERKPRPLSPSIAISIHKVDPGPSVKLLEGTDHHPVPTGPHPNPHRFKLFEDLLKRRKVIPLPGRPGIPIDISHYPGSDLLTDEEFEVCCVLRLTPQQYFASRKALVENHRRLGFYKKSAAQKMLKIDVNKTGKLYDFFQENGWLPRDDLDKNYHDPEDIQI